MKPLKLTPAHKDYIWGGEKLRTVYGKEREFHIDKGVKVANCSKLKPRDITTDDDGTRIIGDCEYFTVREITLNGDRKFISDEKTYHALLVVDGNVDITGEDFCMNISVGETVFVSAGMGNIY